LSASSSESVYNDRRDDSYKKKNTHKLNTSLDTQSVTTRSSDSLLDNDREKDKEREREREKEEKRKSSTVREKSPRDREPSGTSSYRRGLTMSEADLQPLPEQPKPPKRTLIAQELLATEENYLTSLNLCLDHYYYPFQKRIGDLFTQAQFSRIFSNFPVIIQCNRMLCDELKKRINDSVWDVDSSKVSDVFIKLAQSFLIYSDFVNGYNDSVAELKSLGTSPVFAAFLQECDKSTNKLHRIQDYLIMPVQLSLVMFSYCRNCSSTHLRDIQITRTHRQQS